MEAIRDEASRRSYRSHAIRAEAAASAQLGQALEAIERRRDELAAELAVAAEQDRARRDAELDLAATGAGEQLTRAHTLAGEAAAAAGAAAADAVGVEQFERRMADLEASAAALLAGGEKQAAERLAAAVADAERRLAVVEASQRRGERVRERTAAAEHEAAERVREAERRLVEVLARIDVADRRGG